MCSGCASTSSSRQIGVEDKNGVYYPVVNVGYENMLFLENKLIVSFNENETEKYYLYDEDSNAFESMPEQLKNQPQYDYKVVGDALVLFSDGTESSSIVLSPKPSGEVYVEFSNTGRYVSIAYENDKNLRIFDLLAEKWLVFDVSIRLIKWNAEDSRSLIQTQTDMLYGYQPNDGSVIDLGVRDISSIHFCESSDYLYSFSDTAGNTGLYVFSLFKKEWIKINDEVPYGVFIEDDKIYYIKNEKSPSMNLLAMNGTNNRYYLVCYDAEKGVQVLQSLITKSNYAKGFIFSPSGKSIFFLDGEAVNAKLYKYNF
jgi:WD40 repeat protein